MLMQVQGNLLEADAEALVNTVNTVGVMGKGIALQFKKAFPENFAAYKRACDGNEVVPGKMFVFETNGLHNPKYIINFPTKRHWRERSRMADIEEGLRDLAATVVRLGIHRVAVPPLGCGNGGLDWGRVFPRMETLLSELPDVQFLVYAPNGAPTPQEMPNRTTRPRMTAGRAAVLGLIRRYGVAGYRTTLLEVQKLVYFLQVAGEPLERVQFVRGKYGPYADTLRHVLNRMEGHFIQGYGDGANRPGDSIELLGDAMQEAEAFLEGHKETKKRFDRVTRLIEGFETPYGMELLATVHWVGANEDMLARGDVDAAIAGVKAWSARKKEMFKPEHIKVAWTRLNEQQWW
ncbi:MAG: macro domain-containing protein [Candidatus Hydrogenedens sp.]|nr:macro domain-containing protein [Candidatus Hydrogenedentota bacterium]NLF57517.1 macro domain-containing protein [Candidatus Hydrogenedens sp.]